MSNRKAINWTIGLCFVAANVLGLGLSHHRRQAEAATHQQLMELQGRQNAELTGWYGSDSVPIGSSMCLDAIRRLGSSEQLTLPAPSTEVDWNELPRKQANDLANAIQGLMVAYRRGGASHLVNYMATRGVSLAPENVEILSKYLITKHGFKDAELQELALDQQFAMFWDAYGVTPEWKAFVPQK